MEFEEMNRGHPVGCMYALPLLDHDARRTLAGNTIIRIVASCRQAVTSTMIKKYFAKSGQLILTGFTHQDLVECETGSVFIQMHLGRPNHRWTGSPGLVFLPGTNE